MAYVKHFLKRSICLFDVRFYSVYNSIHENSSEIINNAKKSSFSERKSTPYYFEDGLRKVYPFYFKFSCYCKGRWIGKTVLDMYCEEFALHSKEDVSNRINKGLVKVNNQIVELDYILRNKDIISSYIHRHDLPVLSCTIDILYEDDNFVVVNKPPSIPVHTCGLYKRNTMLAILAREYKKRNLYVIYRLDRLVSGVLVFVKSSTKSNEIHEEIHSRNVKKEYVCRVEGNFPDGTVICNKPIKRFRSQIGISLVHAEGKEAFTEFKKLSYNGKSSVVVCKPYTGRTHQIRVHLQYLGHPIVNDPLYNSFVFGSLKGKNGVIEKPISEIQEDLLMERFSEWRFDKVYRDKNTLLEKDFLKYTIFKEYYMNKELQLHNKDTSRITYDENCFFCKINQPPEQTTLGMFLHACKYGTEKWSFEAPMPFWASDDWNVA